MFWLYITVGIIIIFAGFAGMFTCGDEVDPQTGKEVLRYVSLWTAGSWTAAILWPVLLASVLPALFIYGTITAVRAAKNKSLNY